MGMETFNQGTSSDTVMLEDLIEKENKYPEGEVSQEEVPLLTDINWPDYVMEQFDESELDRGYPKVNGLRRVTELLMGEIIESFPEVIQCPCPENERRATVVYHVRIRTPKGVRYFADGADAYDGNMTNPNKEGNQVFTKFPTAIAVTRAEARALRKCLKLNVVAAEELIPGTTEERITNQQLNVVDIICKKVNVNAVACINGFCRKLKIDEGKPTKIVGVQVIQYLNKVQSKEVAVDAKIVGYIPDWKKEIL